MPRIATSQARTDEPLRAGPARSADAVGAPARAYDRHAEPGPRWLRDLEIAPDGEVAAFVLHHLGAGIDAPHALGTVDVGEVERLRAGSVDALVNLRRINDVRRVNRYFLAVHSRLPVDGLFVFCMETLVQRRARILAKFPWPLAHLYYVLNFVFKRVFPKLPLTKQLYFHLTRGRNRIVSEAEALGRLYCCGFEVVAKREIGGLLHVVARKTGPPREARAPSYGPLFRMQRCGQGGKQIGVYKLRTMHPYSEYLQEYVYAHNSLDVGGKFRDDFRVTGWGHWCRRFWIDEIPMLINWIRGELKLVGVRPLSFHYLGLYPEPLRSERQAYRPGLVPPFYADLPQTFEEILESERAYLEAYARRPLRTDCRYLLRAVYNIVFRHARSR